MAPETEMVRAIPIWQPWASLIAWGSKRIETRSKPAPATVLGRRVAIHACKTQAQMWRVATPPFIDHVIRQIGDREIDDVLDEIPFGALVCTAVVAESRPVTGEFATELEAHEPDEFAFGDYRARPAGSLQPPIRHAWVLQDVQPLAEPVEFKGSQGIFFVAPEMVGMDPAPTPVETQGVLL